MHTYKIYLERADDDSERAYLGTVQADTMSDALDLAAQWNEIPAHDLVAVLVDEPVMRRCPYCGQMHQADQVEQCPLKPHHE